MRIRNTRKARFKSALAMVGMTQQEWARQNDITADHLSMVISDTYDRESKVLEDKIDAFTAEVAAKIMAA